MFLPGIPLGTRNVGQVEAAAKPETREIRTFFSAGATIGGHFQYPDLTGGRRSSEIRARPDGPVAAK
jgi:hypothetical protein